MSESKNERCEQETSEKRLEDKRERVEWKEKNKGEV